MNFTPPEPTVVEEPANLELTLRWLNKVRAARGQENLTELPPWGEGKLHEANPLAQALGEKVYRNQAPGFVSLETRDASLGALLGGTKWPWGQQAWECYLPPYAWEFAGR